VRSRWLDIGEFMDLDQYPAMLTSRLVNNPYILLTEKIFNAITVQN